MSTRRARACAHSRRALRLAREAAAKALAIDPDYAPAHGRLGWIAMSFDGDLAAAARHYEHALALEPANTDIIGNAADLAANLNRLDTAIALYEYAIARDPLNTVGHANLGLVYLGAGRLDEAIASYRTVLRLAPDYGGAHAAIGDALLLKGEAQAALTETQKESEEVWRLLGLTMVYHTLGRKADSDAALAELIQEVRRRLGLQHCLRSGLAQRARPRVRVARQGGDPARPGPVRDRVRAICSPISTTIRAGCRSCARSARRRSNSRRSSST